ncbi:hypothetical protein BDL97_06G025400 [Sphagnum fallax]|nr:hypothetical protein BDL97_06G025400 [Sphagnum fallax]
MILAWYRLTQMLVPTHTNLFIFEIEEKGTVEALCLLRGVAFDMGAAGRSGKIGSGGAGRDSTVISSD